MRHAKLVVKVAKKFSQLLLVEIGKAKLAKAVKRNRAQKDPNVCHTHDFCDANVVMHHALGTCKVIRTKLSIANASKLWDEAWGMAKKAEFDESRIK